MPATTSAPCSGCTIRRTRPKPSTSWSRYAKQDPKDCADAYDFYITKLKLFGVDGDVSDAVYEKMADGLADIGIIKKPYPPKSAIFDGSFVQAASH